MSQWLYELLAGHVHDIAVVPGERNRGNKNDRIDAHRLADRMRTGDLGTRIFKAPESLVDLRELVRCYGMVNKDVVRTKNRIRSLYRSRGISAVWQERAFSKVDREAAQGLLKPGARQAVAVLYGELDTQEELKAQMQEAMIREAKKHSITRVLRTAPGFGAVRAAQLLAIVIVPYRFRTARQFWSYCGLGIVQRSSSDWVMTINKQWIKAPVVQTRGLNRNCNRTAKQIFKGAACTVISRMRNEPLRADYERLLANGTKPNLATLTIARKIAAIVLTMWKNQEVYDPKKYRNGQE